MRDNLADGKIINLKAKAFIDIIIKTFMKACGVSDI